MSTWWTVIAATIRALREAIPGVIVEVLTPDFKGKRWCIRLVVEARPDIYNHNIETVERLSPSVRPQARYDRTLDLLRAVKNMDSGIHTKSGIMLGLGETHDEIVQTLSDLREAGVSDLAQTTLMSDGASVYLCTSNDEVIDLVSRGQGVFGIAVGKVLREVETSLVELDSERPDVTDELAARRATRAS